VRTCFLALCFCLCVLLMLRKFVCVRASARAGGEENWCVLRFRENFLPCVGTTSTAIA